jgi:cyanophycinase
MIKFILLFLIPFNLSATSLILIGGGKRPKAALSYFVQKKKVGPIYVLPWGTSYPQESFETIAGELSEHGRFDIRCFCSETFSSSDCKNLENAGAIYFPGGNQNKVMKRIFEAKIKGLLLKLFNDDIPIAGTSAGTAIQSNPMLTGSGFRTTEGLGLLKNYIVDQHFLVRSRQERLLGVLNNHPNLNGLGIDEDMSAVIEDSKVLTALGPTIVTLYLRVNHQIKKVELTHNQIIQDSF